MEREDKIICFLLVTLSPKYMKLWAPNFSKFTKHTKFSKFSKGSKFLPPKKLAVS